MRSVRRHIHTYRKHCSTETALLKVQDDILKNLDKRKGVVFLLLDLSAAFDTVDHGTLINTLKNEVGVTGECLAWIQSYLEERQQRVIINNNRSDSIDFEMWGTTGFCVRPSAVLYLHYSTRGHNEEARHVISSVCR